MVNSVIESVVNGIADKIDILFDQEYPIYPSNREQGVNKPCFFIKYISGNERREIGLENKFYKDLLHFDIIGMSEDNDESILHVMIDKLYELEYIELSDGTILRSSNLDPKIEDGVLHFMIDFSIFIEKESQKATKMNDLNFEEEVKNDES